MKRTLGSALIAFTFAFGIIAATSTTADAQWGRNRDYSNSQVQQGYNYGLSVGTTDAQRGQSYSPQRSQYYRNASSAAFRNSFVQGYDQGYRQIAQSNRNGGYRNDGYYGNNGRYGGYNNQQINAGYQQGINTGSADGRSNKSYDPQRSRYFKNASTQAYREGFVRGYDEGYRQYSNNGYQRSNTAGSILEQIFRRP